ncbi:3-oxoadipate enol-lactonase [Aureimonas ureilytica]|uniref:3-oxoadipate enol-lactonase n=1 Tax=Aureimonas ureilytica TaxID=401562 RepID=A0A175RBK3_9HYPH|nr:3-oxoadipate enol-lactonase [Aureimonas ureilytica]KTQ97028.1 3-oxoadipate enol-lactonase [Aureimonas ureilytica]
MAFITANGIAIHAEVEGRAGAPRLVFLNSLGSDRRIWGETVARLAARFEILTFDQRGHGLSETGAEPITIPLLAGDVTALLDALGWSRVSLVGLSIGGLIAQHLAIHHPERVDRLVLLDTAARIGSVESWNARIAAVRGEGLKSISETVLRGWVSEGFPAAQTAPFAAWRRMFEATPAQGYVGACEALREADYTELVATIRAPTLALAGDCDRATTPDLVRATAERIPGARFEVIAGSGHLPCLERAEDLAALIAGHVGTSESGETSRFEAGMNVRRAVLGEAHVNRATAAITPFDAPFQRFITEGAWGSVWARSHFTRRERSIVTIALLAALGQDDEVAMHVRATANTGASPEDVAEALLHVAVYAGVPAANHAIKIAKTTFTEMTWTEREGAAR